MDSVKVALRIRPLVQSEMDIGCRPCVERIPNQPQISVGRAKQMFTFNYIFDEFEGQGKVYNEAVHSLIDNLFKGYNVTILAYGQTGSGKTFTMGTNYSGEGELGVIPRAVFDIFKRIEEMDDHDFKVSVSFIELYNESLYDLLTQKPREQSVVDMREYKDGICIPGLTELDVVTPQQTLDRLKEGSSGRVVGCTAMNSQSSRSHAIFTVNIRIMPKDNPQELKTSKFHLVDLAGSERSKKTGTTGDQFKEGININRGLLALGNVISQLGEGIAGFINYRDSKLTRLLQDSLGGNSVTLMIACISPADYNQDETLSTLRYADRARKIKNKPVINQDPRLVEISRLKKENEELRLKLISNGNLYECPPEHKTLKSELLDAQKLTSKLRKDLREALGQSTSLFDRVLMFENTENKRKEKLAELSALSETLPTDDPRLEDLKAKIIEIQDDQKKSEKELLTLETESEQEDEEEGEEADGEMATQTQEFIMNKVKINREIVSLNKSLAWKEQLMATLAESSGQLVRMQGETGENVEELKRQLAELKQEKEELVRQLNSGHQQANSAKVAETRRKRLQELENKVAVYMKKLTEQERIIKMKEKSDEKIVNLKRDIMSMKQLKVRLMQQLKTENDKFKTWKAEKDREVCQLRSQNMKKQNQLKRMEQMHSMQQSVLRRKLEAAAAANKRIMAALERTKAARERRNKGGSSERIKERLAEELELIDSEYQAQKSLDTLLQDRAALTKDLALLKMKSEDEKVSEEEKDKLRLDQKQIQNELELRSLEISDLQQKLLDIHQGDDKKSHWDMLQSMADAKFALAYLFELASEKIKDNFNKSSLISELKDQQCEADERVRAYQKRLDQMELFQKKNLERMEKDTEEKVHFLLKELRKRHIGEQVNGGTVPELYRIQEEELEKLEKMRTQIEQLEEEVALLRQRNGQRGTAKEEVEDSSDDPFAKFLKERDPSFVNNKGKSRGSKKSSRLTFALADEETLKAFDDSQEIDVDDPDDPDWRNTPIHKRLQALRRIGKRKDFQQRGGKRSIYKELVKCECVAACAMSSCSCVKSGRDCDENCNCEKSSCTDGAKRQRLMPPLDGDEQMEFVKKSEKCYFP